jgi:cytochrome oxidase assembly protein ShyY1
MTSVYLVMGPPDFDKASERKDPSSRKWWLIILGAMLLIALVGLVLWQLGRPTVPTH